ncbi:polysaccharide deacetylase [Flavobacterium noncentrifugens]|uniref:Peptidoglycan/xylan/chitin deacetylase, PgdA/CDA1 family n=1 Tax=Flavobacterium noncentrifugens TaxID=1128970 RepID=A0A1G8RZ96_9FLAO|nr:polysaccharide deacetylase family protein [Flavobacterium noncentrifugens]GEP49640.1 polysaccharide deacetylase [Flavobacterium noncentrifugens]SDJ22269.1 Peptidoglycan/xylan/chitin deacetylase, PgdA/CDA1 family [Flavobacterium noncentrifugens]
MKLWIKTHKIIKWLFPKYVWEIPNAENKVYLTFDDGPIPEVTEFVLSELKKYNAKATFFCIGDNIRKNPGVFKKVIASGNAIGNHTFNHLKGWETETEKYIENVKLCEVQMEQHQIKTNLVRPPYGKIKRSQAKILTKSGYRIIMWDIVSADFDSHVTQEECLQNILKNVASGSIIVFHDSIKAFPNMRYALPETLKFLSEKGFKCEVLA